MQIVIDKSQYAIPHDLLLSAIWRYDLIPVPLTIEFQVRISDEINQLVEGDKIAILEQAISMTIIKKIVINTELIQDDKHIKLCVFTAVLSGCENLIIPKNKAINLSNTSFSAAYRACGAKVHFGKDIPIIAFDVFYGRESTYEIARKCGEEAAVICYADGKVNAIKLNEIKNKKPRLMLSNVDVSWENNKVLESGLVSGFITINADGTTIEESLKDHQNAEFYPNMDTRRLKNLRTVLVKRGSFIRPLSPDFYAGDTIEIENKTYIIITVAHRYDTGAMGKNAAMASRFWFGEIVNG